MRPPLRNGNAMILSGALATPRHAICLLTLIVLAAIGNDLRPALTVTPGAPVEVDPVPPAGSTSAPPFTFSVGRPR